MFDSKIVMLMLTLIVFNAAAIDASGKVEKVLSGIGMLVLADASLFLPYAFNQSGKPSSPPNSVRSALIAPPDSTDS